MKILSKELAQSYQVTSLQRGHSVFTSFLAKQGRILFLDDHIERLTAGADFLFPNQEWKLSHKTIKQYVENEFSTIPLVMKKEIYFRLTIFDDCIYLQYRDQVHFVEPLKLTIALKIKTPGPMPSFVKVSHYVEADLELRRAYLEKFNEVVFFDYAQNVTEASTSNLFIVKENGDIVTPPLSSMILDGITRKKLLGQLRNSQFSVYESPICKADLLKAKEIWLTNAVKGIRFVDQFEINNFKMENSLFLKVVAIFGQYGELI